MSKTKLVEVRLFAMTRVEYTEVVRVPADFTRDDVEQLVGERWDSVEASEFEVDSEYREKGNCYGRVVDESELYGEEPKRLEDL